MLVYAVPYLLRGRTLARAGRPVPRWRTLCFMAGLLALIGADIAPVREASNETFAIHMVEHLIISDVAALLLVLGLTGPVMAPVLRVKSLGWLRALSHPLVALPAWAINLYAWHLPFLYENAVRHDWLHAVEHFCFLFFALTFWMALLGPLPKPAWFGNLGRLGYIIAARMIGAVLANVFLWSGTIFYADVYPSAADQSTAGAIMMVEESVLTIVLFGWLFVRAARQSWERDELLALAAANGVELDEARATRAVAAGRGDDLRKRLVAPS